MNWLQPITFNAPSRPVPIRKKDGALMPYTGREVEVLGVRYPSMVSACRALGWSYSKVYYAIGENWRCR